MKKTKLLIPALSIASVGAVVAPMVTSCAKANGISFEAIKDGEWNTDYTPMEGPKTLKYKNKKAFADGLTSTINSNPKIWADDVIVNYLDTVTGTTPDVTSSTISVSNAKITNKMVDLPDPLNLVIVSCVSFDINIKNTKEDASNAGVTDYQTIEYHVKNMPYTFYKDKKITFRKSTEVWEYDSPVAVPSLLTLMNSSSDPTGLDLPSYLTFIESGFSLSFATKYWDSEGEVFTDFGFTLDNVETLIRVMQNETVWGMFSEYFAPLQLPIQSNYFVNATYTEE